jgi:lipopolysaccharide transport protein LptA
MIELRGRSSVEPESASATSLRALSARDINLHYAPDGSALQRAVLAGEARVEFAAAGTGGTRTLTAEWIEMLFSEDGQSLTSLVARDGVQLQFPIENGGPARRIRSVSLEAAGEAGRGLTTARFLDQVNFRETRLAAGADKGYDREIRAQTLDTVVTPGLGEIQAADFGGGVRFVDDPTNASAPDLQYNVLKGTAKLLASAGGAGAIVTDDTITIEARQIDLTLDGKGLVADQDVRSVLKATRGARPASDGAAAPKRPGMLKDDQPVNVTAAHLVYEAATHRATYTGEARLWQGETAVQGNTIVLDDQAGNLSASGNVRSVWRLADTDPKTKQVETKTTVATAEDLVYDDATRRATYTTNARMNGPEGDVKADKIELYLEQGGGALDRAEAYVKVSLRSQNRTSIGNRLSYFAADARYVMSGTPVHVYEQLPAECRETVGRTLTFFRSTDSISVDGNREGRTQTMSGGKCSEPQS